MIYNPNIHHRRSIRLKGYDYAQAGLYFITIMVHDRTRLFGEIREGEMILNGVGEIADKFIKFMPEKYCQTKLHAYIIMPNHVHFIVEILGAVGAIHESPQQMHIDGAIQEGAICDEEIQEGAIRDEEIIERAIRESPVQSPIGLSKIVGWYKMNTAKQINIIRQKAGVALWQRDYYEHIIRNERSYQNISNYIINNPANWDKDKFFGSLPKIHEK